MSVPPSRSSRNLRVGLGLFGGALGVFSFPFAAVGLVETYHWDADKGPANLALLILFGLSSIVGARLALWGFRPDPLDEGNAERGVLSVATESGGIVSEASVVMRTALSLTQVRGAIKRMRKSGLLQPVPDMTAAYRVLGLPPAPDPVDSSEPAPVLPAVTPETLGAVASRHGLTPTEANVLQLLSTGLSNEEIGKRLFVSSATVRTHVYNIFRKLGVRSRLQAALLLSPRQDS